MKVSGKIKIFILLGSVLVVAITASFVHLYKQKNYWQEVSAEYNIYHWDELYLMSDKLENMGISKETLNEMYPYVNAKVFSSTTGIYPAFNGDATYTSFLNTYYVSLAQDIAYRDDLSDQRLYEATALFEEINSELRSLCRKVLDKTESPKDKVALRDTNSKLYAEVEEMVRQFCNENGNKISKYNLG